MLKKRIIPCLDIRDGRTVKGVNFVEIRDAGDPVELASRYADEGADELVFLDITATVEKRKTLVKLVERISREVHIPFTVGGGIKSLADVDAIIKAGADKVTVNSAAVDNPDLLNEIANTYGSQCLVLAVDTKWIDGDWLVAVHGGRKMTPIKTKDWLIEAEEHGVGEVLLTSMDHDGTKEGFALKLLNEMSPLVNIPIIASGGAGSTEHFKEVFTKTKASAALAASVFHFGTIPIPELKNYLRENKIPVRCN
jgi:cyclase